MAGSEIDETATDYQFTEDWLAQHLSTWEKLIPRYEPRKILEIGSFEGRSACFFIETCAQAQPIELHCIDNWQGSVEHDPEEMRLIEDRFDHNISVAMGRVDHPVKFVKHKSLSRLALAKLIAANPTADFDLIYVDGSHQAPDVLADAVMSFQLLRLGGLIILDDYLWSMEPLGFQDAFNMPKPAIDAFINIYQRKLFLVRGAPVYQMYATKIAD